MVFKWRTLLILETFYSYFFILIFLLDLSSVQLFTSQGNGVVFLTKPRIERTNNTTIIKDCQYSSSRNESLNEYAFINFNGTSYNVNSNSNTTGEGIHTIPQYMFPCRINNGDVQCVLKIGEEIFHSNASKIYDIPGIKCFITYF